jgi:8-oxo-dGTP diphosphatase
MATSTRPALETAGTEDDFLGKYDLTAYPRPSVTVDIVLFTVVDGQLRVLLIRRGTHPFLGHWALPGGFIRPQESAEEAARRELREEAGAQDIYLEQLFTFSRPGRDPRGWVVSVAYYALVTLERLTIRAGDDASDARWFQVRDGVDGAVEAHALPGGGPVCLAFDHADILATALQRIRGKLDYVPIGFQLLPPRFTLTQLQVVHQAVLGRPLDKRNFRAKVQRDRLVVATPERVVGPHRPAQLFRYNDKRDI